MATVDYRDRNENIRNRYLYPEKENIGISNILIPALEYTAFFTPAPRAVGRILGKVFRPIWQGLVGEAGAKAAATSAVSGLSKRAKDIGQQIKARAATGASAVAGAQASETASKAWNKAYPEIGTRVTKATEWMEARARGMGKRLMPMGEAAVEKAGAVGRFIGRHPGKIALGGLLYGGLTAMTGPRKAQPIADVGMGYPPGTTWVRKRKDPVGPGHLGATGDLVFALRDGR